MLSTQTVDVINFTQH